MSELAWTTTEPTREGWYFTRRWVIGRQYRGKRAAGYWGLPLLAWAYQASVYRDNSYPPGDFRYPLHYRFAGSPCVYVLGRSTREPPDEWAGPVELSAWPPWDDESDKEE